jgi:trk system potassium uptake protein TrkH
VAIFGDAFWDKRRNSMNTRLVTRQLGLVCLLIGVFMVLSLPWSHPSLGFRNDSSVTITGQFERGAFFAVLDSVAICLSLGLLLLYASRQAQGKLYRKEAMAIVGLSWVLATVLGAMPFYLAKCARGPCVRLDESRATASLLVQSGFMSQWKTKSLVDPIEVPPALIAKMLGAGIDGLSAQGLAAAVPHERRNMTKLLDDLVASDPDWADVLVPPAAKTPWGESSNYRIRIGRMSFVDTMFESQSGFSTTGATVITNLEDARLMPHCLLFWRSSTHFLGGLGIIVLFVVVLGQGSAGKALMQAELPGPTQDSVQARIQHAAWLFAGIYSALNVALTVIYRLFGMSWFDAVCHAFGTMATGGFSTYNSSLGHFDHAGIEYVTVLFMVLAGSNFTLLILFLRGKPLALFSDVEWQTYAAFITVATVLVVVFGLANQDFASLTESLNSQIQSAVRYGLFQVVSIMTTTGYGTHDFDTWHQFSRALLLGLMFVGGCAGSTGGGMKVIRHLLLFRIVSQEVELSFRPTVVRPLRLGGKALDDPALKTNILVYFAIITLLFVSSWYFVLLVEPDSTWGSVAENKMIDSASAVIATLNNIGPGLGTVGATCNYAHLSAPVKLLFTWLMMLGRVEVYVILCLFVPRFWRTV